MTLTMDWMSVEERHDAADERDEARRVAYEARDRIPVEMRCEACEGHGGRGNTACSTCEGAGMKFDPSAPTWCGCGASFSEHHDAIGAELGCDEVQCFCARLEGLLCNPCMGKGDRS